MIKNIFTFGMLFFLSMVTHAQTFKIRALDGNIRQVHFSHEVGDQKLIITSLKDTIIIDDFIGLSEDIAILKKSFLSIHYDIRSGSDQSREMLLLLCVNNHKLSATLHILSRSTYDLAGDHGDYKAKINLIGTDKGRYKLNVNVHDQSESKISPKTNHSYNKIIILSFDANLGVFYNARKDLSKYFTIYDPKSESTIKQHITGTFPAIEIGDTNYYYINGEWYEQGHEDNLFKFTYK